MKRYIFSINPAMEDFMEVLAEYIGPTAFYMNLYWLANRALELIFLGKTLGDPGYMDRFFVDVKVPSDMKDKIATKFYNDINNAVRMAIKDYDPSHSYEYQMNDMGDVSVEDLGKAIMFEPKLVNNDTFFEEIKTSIENGDYVPEKLRRLVG